MRGPAPGLRVTAVLLALAAALQATVFATTSPLFSSADEMAHLDYAYQLWHGRLPVFDEGLRLEPGFGKRPPVQWVAQHPPLYYAVLAPLVGPLLDSGHVVAAGLVGRAVNALVAAALVVAVVWAARQVCPARRRVAVAAGVVVACNPWVVRVGGSIYNDGLAALWGTLLLGVTAQMIRRGISGPRLVLLGAAAAAALLTRASLAIVLLSCLAVLALDVLVRDRRRVLASWTGLASVGLVAGATSGWFYLRNLRLTGSPLGGDPQWSQQHLGRVERPLSEVVVDPATWKNLLALYSYGGLDPRLVTLLLVAGPLVLAVAVAARHGRGTSARDVVVLAALVVPTATALAQQAAYVAGGGAANPRYLMPLLLPIGVTLGLGIAGWRTLSFVAVPLWTVVAVLDLALWVRSAWQGQTPDAPGTSAVAAHLLLAVAVAALVAALAWERRAVRDPASRAPAALR